MITLNGASRVWRHKSVRNLILSAGGGDPVAIIRSKAREVVAWARQRHWSGPPFNPLTLVSMRGIRARESKNLFSSEAQLTPMDGVQLLLEFNPDRAPCRKNYSICHELIHTFFDDCYEMVHQRNSDRAGFDPSQEVEHLCQVGAAEILMPEEEFTLDLARLGFSLRAVGELCSRYDASREAVARRMLTLTDETASLAFFSRRLKPIEKRIVAPANKKAPEEKMRLLYSVQTPGFPIFLPAHKSVPTDSCVNIASATGGFSSAYEEWDIRDFGRCFVEAIPLPLPEGSDENSPSVIALIQPDK